MWNLTKNILRSLKKNLLALLGLIFLIFLSTGIFTVLNGTTTAINNEYRKISVEGNLHDFTVNEAYAVGVANYTNNTEKEVINKATGENRYTKLYNNDLLVKDEFNGKINFFPYVTYYDNGSDITIFTIQYLLNINGLDDNSALRKFYLEHLDDFRYVSDLYPSISVLANTADTPVQALRNYIDNDQKTGQYGLNKPTGKISIDPKTINSLITNAIDTQEISKQLNNISSDVENIVSTTDTLMDQYLNNKIDGVGNDVTWKNIQSLNIDNSSDAIYYKAVTSEPTDTIDKMVLINDAIKGNGVQWDNIGSNETTYGILTHEQEEENYTIGDTLRYLPDSISNDKYDIHYLEKVWLMSKADFPNPGDFVIPGQVKSLTDDYEKGYPTTDLARQEWWDWAKTNTDVKLSDLLESEKLNKEQASIRDYKVVLNYTSEQSSPYQMVIDIWSGCFCVVSPEYMEQHHLQTMDPSMYENEQSYISYVKTHPGITTQRAKFLGWLNSLEWPKIELWFNNVVENPQYANEVINPGGSTAYIIIGSGITPDFIYPIVSIDRATPNPEKECILFTNNVGFNRLFDGFRGNPCENYIAGKFNKGVNKAQTLNKINVYAAQTMIYPQGTKAAYLANDTSNTLNASAFRIAFIPNFLNDINVVANTLTIFVLILSVIICAIVIHRFIVNNQSVIGIMRANGVSKWAIGTSLLPFALIPCVIGGILGNIVGVLLEIPVLGLFKSYWMLPTRVLGFSFWGLIIPILIFSALFTLIIFATTFWVLRKNVVDLMKANSQDNPNKLSKIVKASAAKFGVITRYRLSVAFGSLWKLLVLVIMTTLTLSSVIFTTSINGKFQDSMLATNKIHNYSYAVKLVTPTTSGGQYKPVCYDTDANGNFLGIGATGFIQAGNDNRDKSYFQSLFFGKENNLDITNFMIFLPDSNFKGYLNGNDYANLLPKDYDGTPINQLLQHNYYFLTYAINYNNLLDDGQPPIHPTEDEFLDSINSAFKVKNNNQTYGDLFVPNMGDLIGEMYDLYYLKDRDMTKSSTDYQVGINGLVMTNPWDIAAALMPDNTKSSFETHGKQFQDFLGHAVYYQDLSDSEKPTYKKLYDLLVANDLDVEKTCKDFIKAPDQDSSLYRLNTDNMFYWYNDPDYGPMLAYCVALRPDAIKMLNVAYSCPDSAKLEYVNYYDKVPLTNNDETYTWIDATNISNNDNVTIYGIKATDEYQTKFINLVDKDNNNLISKLHYTYDDYQVQNKTDNFVFPMVVNQYTKQKYHLNIGSEMNFTINNRADRYMHQMRIDNDIDDSNYDNHAKFKIVGFVNSYEGQEYYIDQDVANYLLRLKSHLFDTQPILQCKLSPNAYYGNNWKTIGQLVDPTGMATEKGIKTSASLINLNDQDYTEYKNLTPYGFNGVFTNDGAKSPLLSNSLVLYSPTGAYFSNDHLNSTDALNTLSFGANIKALADMILDKDSQDKIELFKNINNSYTTWQIAINEGKSDEQIDAAHNTFIENAGDLIKFITNYYGIQVYASDITGAVDKNASEMMYTNMSTTIESITMSTIIVIVLMSAVIVFLITNMIIEDSKKLAAILKALGYTDNENAATYLSIYIPVILLGLVISIAATIGLISLYNTIIFNGMQIWLNAQAQWADYLIGFSVVAGIFILSAIKGTISLKRSKAADAIKG